MILSIFFLAGLILGSFANVLIHRLPQGGTPWNPRRSRCPGCGKELGWRDNIPILSYLILKARCRFCLEKISSRYFWVELTMGAGFALTAWRLGHWGALTPVSVLLYCFFFFVIVTIAFIDLETFMIPDSLSLGLAAVMLLGSPWSIFFTGSIPAKILQSLAGFFAGGLFFWFLAWLGEKIYKKEAMGGGDIKLMAAFGAALGAANLLPLIFLSSLLGLLYAVPQLVSRRLGRRDPIPFGPFLALAAYLVFLLSGRFPPYL